MKKKFSHPQSGIIAILSFGAALFVCSTIVVVAQDFIEPSAQAPANNVIDFITVSEDSQGRSGQLAIDSPASSIPTAGDSVVSVNGAALLQGDTTFGKGLGPSLFINTSKFPNYVTSGTSAANGKFSIASTTSYALYAQSTQDHAVYVNSKSAGNPTTPTKNIFGQTTQVAAGEKSSGVHGTSTNPSGYGVYAVQDVCNGSTFDCGLAGQFYGNVVVTGTIIGDGRGVFKTWTLNDASTTSSATGISLRTITVENDDFSGGDTATYAGIEPGENFVSLSVMINDTVYDPQRAALLTTDAQFLSFTIDQTSGLLTVKKNQTTNIGTAVVTVYYHQQLSVTISVDDDLDGNGTKPDLANPYNTLVGSNAISTFVGELGGGGFDGSQFVWSLYKDTNADDLPDAQCSGNECGSVLVAVGETTSYTAPADFPATGKHVWLRASWTSDSGVYAYQPIDLYKATITNLPASDYLYINGSSHDFNATVECPSGTCPAVTWSVGSSFGNGEGIDAATGVYTPPTQVVSGDSWNGQVQATISGVTPALTQVYEFSLVPHIRITATLEGTNPTSQGPWVSNTTQTQTAHVGISCTSTATCTTGHTLRFEAVAEGIPEVLQHNFNWQTTPFVPTLIGETLISGVGTPSTDNSHQTIVYTAPVNANFSDINQKIRTVRATWRYASGSQSASVRTIQVVLGRGTAPQVSIIRDTGTNGSYPSSYKLFGFSTPDARRIYQVCSTPTCSTTLGTVQVINWAANPNPSSANPITLTPVTCGTLSIVGLGTTDPRDVSLVYTAASAACTQTIYLRAFGDTRASSQIYLESKTTTPTCTGCPDPKKTCCGIIVVDPGGGGGGGEVF